MNTYDDEEIAEWYAGRALSPSSLEKLVAVAKAAPKRSWRLSSFVLPLAAALVAGVGTALWMNHRGEQAPLAALPITFTEAVSIPPRPPPAVPAGMHLTTVSVPDTELLSRFLDPGNYVDVLVETQGTTQTVAQAAFVWGMDNDASEVTLLTTPDYDNTIRTAASQGQIVLSLRNDLDVNFTTTAGVDLDTLRAQLKPRGVTSVLRGAALPPAVQRATGQIRRTASEPVSTFAMDVDTASYTRARGQIDNRTRPHPSEIRVEEFVNAMAYDYPRPSEGVFAAHFEAVPSPWTQDFHLVRVGLRAQDLPDDVRGPLHLTFLVDTSGSMSGNLSLVKTTLKGLVNTLGPQDTVALVQFNDRARVELHPTSVSDTEPIQAAIERLESLGSTGLEGGLAAAYQLAAQVSDQPGTHRVVLCTDGMANVGASDPAALSEQVRPQADLGIGLTALGFGRHGYRDELMEAFADATDGNYAYIDSIDEGRSVLVDRMMETLLVVARDAKAQITWDKRRVEGWRLIGYEDRLLETEQFRDDAVDAGEIGPGHRVTALYEVRLLPTDDPTLPLGTLEVRAEPPGAEGQVAIEQAFSIDPPIRTSLEEASSDTRLAIAAASVALKLAHSPISQLGWGRTAAMARSAARAEYPEDKLLGTLATDAARLGPAPPPPPKKKCQEVKVIQGGKVTTVWVDENGLPCD